MLYTGEVFEDRPVSAATIEIVERPKFFDVSVEVDGYEVMAFPLPLDSDINSLKSRIRNIINQTGMVNNSVRIEIVEVTEPE